MDPATHSQRLRRRCREILTSSWRDDDGCCPPHSAVYPHQWLWDSCFHAIAWGALDDPRGAIELASCFAAQLDSGFVPHMRYLGPTTGRGPLADRSSFTQPPIYAHALRHLASLGQEPAAKTIAAVERGLTWLWEHRRTDDGLIFIVHPWESGADDSPRWDAWIGTAGYDKETFRRHDARLMAAVSYDEHGAAVWSREFVAAPAAFNAFTAHAAYELGRLTASPVWLTRARVLAEAMDDLLWDEAEGLWRDQPLVGGGDSARLPTLDGIFGALSTADPDKAARALDQAGDPDRFAAPFGLAYVPRSSPAYDPQSYWRGPAWPQLNYLATLAAVRWDREDLRRQILAGTIGGVETSGFAEYWNPETGQGLGAIPQGWATLVAALLPADPPPR